MQIEARVVAHSKSSVNGKEIVTFELIYPRIVHSEFLTHRLFSRNAASSRAIPMQKVIDMVRESPAMPVRFGANQAGMQDKGTEHTARVDVHYGVWDDDPCYLSAREVWRVAALRSCDIAAAFEQAGYHKQIGNRLLEPFQWMKTVMTATELDNWFWLRDHQDADPTIEALAKVMWEALQTSVAVVLKPGDWHVPYYGGGYWIAEGTVRGTDRVYPVDQGGVSLEDALAISSSCCAQVSYRKLDDTLEKARTVYERLVGSEPVHASPFEHQATPMQVEQKVLVNDYGDSKHYFGKDINRTSPHTWEQGITHIDRNGKLWSGNFKGWIQHRQLIPNNACWDYKE